MKNLRKLFIVVLGLWLVVAAGCVSSNCNTFFTFTVRAFDNDGLTELPNSSVIDVTLYIFDHNDLFLQEIKTTVGATVKILNPAGNLIKIVACGKLIVLSPTESVHQTPDDLFIGTVILARNTGSSGQIVPIYRKTGKIGVTIEGVRDTIIMQ